MQFSDLYSTQLTVELSSDDTTQLFTTARRKKAVNDGMLAFARQTGCTKRFRSIPIVDGTGEYNVLTTFTDWMRLDENKQVKVKRVNGTSVTWLSGRDLTRQDPDQGDRDDAGWRAVSAGTPQSWYMRVDAGVTYVGLTPPPDVPSGQTWTLWVPYVAEPTAMSADTDLPFLVNAVSQSGLNAYHQALVHYAAAQLEPLRKNFAMAKEQLNTYAGYATEFMIQERVNGPDQVTDIRDYLSETRRGNRAVDWTRFP